MEQRERKLVRLNCEAFQIRILKGGVNKDYVLILVMPPRDGAKRDHAPHQRADIHQVVRSVSVLEEVQMGTAFLGARLLLCDGRCDQRGDDQGILGAPHRARSSERI